MERANGWSRVEPSPLRFAAPRGRGSRVIALDSRLSTLDWLRQKLADTLLHFARGLVGEGDGEDISGRDGFGNEVRDAERDDAGLAGAGPGQDQQRPLEGFDGLALLGIERIQIQHARGV